jgi:predicted sulfurtransferase
MRRERDMKTCTIALVALLLAFSGYFAGPAFAAEAPRMEKDELKAKLGNPEVVVIDVRSYTDWLLSGDKIKGAVRENYRDFEGWSAKYPKDKAVVLYCA